ncbi:MAG: Cbb3-type cytochrome oxidase component FixQ [Rickettsiaceae bacterium]|jgi:cbb3-type cytochrome oxidase subunit 3|nr:Cbb3-type cytochrome oxidase component FixQ [Rickettsiaceae bacterium]
MMEFIVRNAPIISLLFFFSVFCVIVIFILLPKNKSKFKNYSEIPFKDEQKTRSKNKK